MAKPALYLLGLEPVSAAIGATRNDPALQVVMERALVTPEQ